jgi:N-ethylmaleimide reductase
MLNGGYTADRAASDIQAGKAQLISFGNTYISNPDLVARMQQGAALTLADPNTFYTPGAEGYNDYATL